MMKTNFDNIVELMEQMMLASADVKQEQENANDDLAEMIRNERYLPAKEKLVQAFRLAIREIVQSEMNKKSSSKKWGLL
jgi:hypothetical protein